VIPLDEDGTLPVGSDRPGEDGGRVVDRALERVRLLAAGELQDHGADVGRGGRLVDGAGHVEDLGPEVDRGDREAAHLAASPGHVELVDARRAGAERLGGFVDQPAGDIDDRPLVGEGRGPDDVADDVAAKRRRIVDDEPFPVHVGGIAEPGEEISGVLGDVRHVSSSPVRGGRPSC